MDSRRKFIGTMATGLATTLASSSGVLGANSQIRLGVIGAGARGIELAHQVAACPNASVGAFADIYTQRLEDAKRLFPAADIYLDHRRLLEDSGLDAVVIATPQHLHGEHFVNALDAGKHVYQEKTMAFTVEQAKRMRAAHLKSPGLTVQIGHQSCSSGAMRDALGFLASGHMGRITAIHMYMYRNTPHGKPQWSRPIYPNMTADKILWGAFLGDAQPREFDPHRYLNWRFFWDYSGGNVHENMCQQLAFWYKALNLQIPQAVTMTGGLYLWKDGREVPDTMNVAIEQPEEMLISWKSGFGNNQPGVAEEVLGTDGSILKSQTIRYVPQKVNRPSGVDLAGKTIASPAAHLQDFLDCIRNGREPNCPFEIGYRVSIACRMAVESFLDRRTVRWDAQKEAIV